MRAPRARAGGRAAARGFPARSHASPGPAGSPSVYKTTGPARLCRLRESRTHTLAPPRTHRRTRALCAPPDSAQAVLGGGCGFLRLPAALSRPTQQLPTPHLGARGSLSRRAAGRGAPCCPGQGSARSVGARVLRAGQRPPGSGKLPARLGRAQGAEGARRRSSGFARFLMGRICSGLRFKKKFDLWNRRLGEFKLDATD